MITLQNRRAGLLIATSSAALSLAGCASYPAAVPVAEGGGIYSVESSDRGDEAYQGAIRFCFEQGRQLLRVDGLARGLASAGGVIRFRCVSPGEPGWKEPVG